MKIFCCILVVCMALFTQSKAQTPPPSVTITPILPSGFWTPYLNAKLVIIVSKNDVISPAPYFSQTLSNNIINIEKCYAPSVLPASSTFIDTLSLGPLAHGSYTVNFKFLWTLDYPNCDRYDSVTFISTFIHDGDVSIMERKNEENFKLIPNPVQQNVYFESENGILPVKVEIRDVLGKLVFSEENNDNIKSLNLADLKSGTFFMELIFEDKTRIRKKVIKS